jgi:thiol-disulfide isomerase/thioredoxin
MPTSVQPPVEGELASLGSATEWINSPPLTAAGLRGKVVLIDIWTYTCINSLRPMSYINRWEQRYKDRGLVVVGIHTPEFSFEALPVNVAVVTVDGGGSPPATGVVGDDFIPIGCTALEWVLQANTVGNVVVDIWVAPFVANTPPTVANSITAANLPTLTASSGRASAVLTGWSRSIAAGSWIRYNLVSVTTISRFTLTLVATVP